MSYILTGSTNDNYNMYNCRIRNWMKSSMIPAPICGTTAYQNGIAPSHN